jgi:photosystem II stability/assembly factor-like uncharacterized protein
MQPQAVTHLRPIRVVALALLTFSLLGGAGVRPAIAPAFGSTGDDGWYAQVAPARENLNDVCFLDAQHGWAVGGHGTILATSDGGATWTPQRSGTDVRLEAVTFADTSRGWVVGFGGTILVTSDGGAIWTPQGSGTDADLESVVFVDAVHGWAVGSAAGWGWDACILATSDGGATWTRQRLGVNARLHDVTFVDASCGWAVGQELYEDPESGGQWSFGVILATSDGGATWTAQTRVADLPLNAVAFADSMHGWVVGEWNVVLDTRDAGANWTEGFVVGGAALSDVTFIEADRVWAVGHYGTILATSDGATTWTPQSSGTTVYLSAISFVDRSHGWAVGEDGTILATVTGGWPDTIPPEASLPRVQWCEDTFALTVTDALSPSVTVRVRVFKAAGKKDLGRVTSHRRVAALADFTVELPTSDVPQQVPLPAGLHPGRPYRFVVQATDQAGNTQEEPASGVVRVR